MTTKILTRIWTGTGTIILALVLLGWSASSYADVINACVNRTNGQTRIVNPPNTCKNGEIALQLNAAGVTYELGDDGPNGGIVYYVDGSGEHGLEAQPADENTMLDWNDAVIAANAHGLGWHLPTKTELELLYEQENVVGGFNFDVYWSSTKAGGSVLVWIQNVFSGLQYREEKSNPFGVRAVRAF